MYVYKLRSAYFYTIDVSKMSPENNQRTYIPAHCILSASSLVLLFPVAAGA
jgi:hypothetical protein